MAKYSKKAPYNPKDKEYMAGQRKAMLKEVAGGPRPSKRAAKELKQGSQSANGKGYKQGE